MDVLVKIVVIALLMGALWWGFQPRFTVVVRIRDGVARVTRGKAPATFVREVEQVCGATVSRGWVGGARKGQRVVLAFSRSIPESCRQQLRNLWHLHG